MGLSSERRAKRSQVLDGLSPRRLEGVTREGRAFFEAFEVYSSVKSIDFSLELCSLATAGTQELLLTPFYYFLLLNLRNLN